MHLNTLVWRELAARRGQLATGLLAVVLGVAAVVGIHTVATYSEKAVARELDALLKIRYPTRAMLRLADRGTR
jgi:hypothetical protein